MRRASAAVAVAVAFIASASVAARPDPGAKLQRWTTTLRDAQNDLPLITRYNGASASLTFIGVVHETDPHSRSFRMIEQAARTWRPRAVIVEGIPTRWGSDDPRIDALGGEALDARGRQPSGETVPAIRWARSARAEVWGGETDDVAVKTFVRRYGVSDRDLLGFYVLRVVPQWLREGTISSTRDPKLAELVNRQLIRSGADLQISADVLPDSAAWASWYERVQGKPVTGGLADDEAGPLADGRWPTNRISELVGRARDAHLFALARHLLRRKGKVMIVFGASHAVVTRPAFDALLGKPCYTGTSITLALSRCRR